MKEAVNRAQDTRAQDARAKILDVAAALFRERGFAAVSLRDIAAAADMKAGSLYYHFASKEEMVVEILNQGIMTVHDDVVRATQGLFDGGGRRLLRAAITAHLTSLLRRSDYTSANIRIFGQVPESVRARNLEVRHAYEAHWDLLIKRLGQSRASKPSSRDVRLARLMMLGALNASLEWFDPSKGSVEALAERYTDLFWDGFAQKFSDVEAR